jgi:hypothetical protein
MDLHYLVNRTMETMEREFFIPSLPNGFQVNRHHVEIPTSGDFMKDGYLDLILAKTRTIFREIENNPDGGLMTFSDVDVIFFGETAPALIEQAMIGFDLLFQKESACKNDETCNFGIQVIRRNKTTKRFYQTLLDIQLANRLKDDQVPGNDLLHSFASPRWGHLPVIFSSESNGGLDQNSVLYHANATISNSQERKRLMLKNALKLMNNQVGEEKLIPAGDKQVRTNYHSPKLAPIISVLEEFLNRPDHEEFIWLLDDSVYSDEPTWKEFVEEFNSCSADLIGTQVRVSFEDPKWTWWDTLAPPPDTILARGDQIVAAFLPLARVSRAAAQVIIDGCASGWTGHPEVLLPTLVRQAGLVIEDIGGGGCFTPPERKGRWYDKRTWHWQGPVKHVPSMLHFPVARQKSELAAGRILVLEPKIKNHDLKMLYVSPVGSGARELLPDVLAPFLAARADCLLLQYDESELTVPDNVRVIHDAGYKFPLALRHLHPDAVADYDFIFFWDDDLGVRDFNPEKFAQIMLVNRLDMAQPAIVSPHGLSHSITEHRPCPPPWRSPDGRSVHPVVGRLTNFVEIMAPVFTREAWREFYDYLDPENRSGWGYDYIPLGRKGIVDAMPVVHTRAVQSINAASEAEIRRFLDNQGLFRHAPVEQGWLFEGVQKTDLRDED